MMRTSNLWARSPDGHWRSISCHIPIWVSSGGSIPASEQGDDVSPTDHVLVSAINPRDSICAVVLRPDQAALDLRINGLDMALGGLHLLRHGDQITVDGLELWVSVQATPDHDRYDPRRHGTPAFCATTRAPLQTGDAIVVCRGGPDRDCGLLYTADAWATEVPCAECGATAEALDWSPPTESDDGSVDALFQLLGSSSEPAARGG